MEIKVTELEYCKYNINYKAGVEEIWDKRAEVLQAFKNAPVSGFRKGKAPLEVIKMKYKTQIDESLKKALLENAYHNTIFDKKFRPHGAPQFNSALLLGDTFTCEFNLHTKPDFTLAPYKGLDIPKPHEPMSVPEVTEKILQELRVKFGDNVPYSESDFIQVGDNIILDYEGSIDGVKVENLTAQGEMLTVGAGQLKEFEDNLLGMSLGEIREFDIVAPAHSLPSLAGQKIHFKVSLSMGSKNVPCPLDNTLATKMNKNSYEELREFVTNAAMSQVNKTFKSSVNNSICNKLVDLNTFKVPEYLAISEAKYLAHQAKLGWDSLSDVDKEKYLDMGTRNVKLSLILDKIREEEPEAQLSDQEVFEIVKENLTKTKVETSLEDVMKELTRTGMLQVIFARIKDEYVLDFLFKHIRVVE